MDPNNFIDNIKTEKANAVSRYQTFTNITKLFQTLELLVFVTLISWSSTHLPYVLKISCQFVTSVSSYFNNQHVVFVVGNVIVVVCYILSRHSDSVNDDVNGNCTSNGNGDCNFTHRKISSGDQMTSAKQSENQIPVSLNNKTELEFTVKDNSNGNGNFTRRKPISDGQMTSAKLPENKIPVIKEPKTEPKVTGEMGIKAGITRETKKNERRYQRTKSENVRSKNPVKADRELRRSVTEMRRSVAGSSGRIEAVEKMSNEEFRMVVEKFILKQQRFLKEQKMSMVEDDEK